MDKIAGKSEVKFYEVVHHIHNDSDGSYSYTEYSYEAEIDGITIAEGDNLSDLFRNIAEN